MDKDLFEQIALLVFEKAIVQEAITTRNILTDVDGIQPLLQAVVEKKNVATPERSIDNSRNDTQEPPTNNDAGESPPQSRTGRPTQPSDDT